MVPHNVNVLFAKTGKEDENYPRGIRKHSDKFIARCANPIENTRKHIGVFDTVEEAFLAYKEYKEAMIKQVAKLEFNAKNITEECYNAMINYEVEIDD